MKSMTCQQLGGACDLEFQADSFEEIGELCRSHCMEAVEQGEANHQAKMNEMAERMKNPQAMNTWLAERRQEFDSLPEN